MAPVIPTSWNLYPQVDPFPSLIVPGLICVTYRICVFQNWCRVSLKLGYKRLLLPSQLLSFLDHVLWVYTAAMSGEYSGYLWRGQVGRNWKVSGQQSVRNCQQLHGELRGKLAPVKPSDYCSPWPPPWLQLVWDLKPDHPAKLLLDWDKRCLG